MHWREIEAVLIDLATRQDVTLFQHDGDTYVACFNEQIDEDDNFIGLCDPEPDQSFNLTILARELAYERIIA
jgi:hypothetical protein